MGSDKCRIFSVMQDDILVLNYDIVIVNDMHDIIT